MFKKLFRDGLLALKSREIGQTLWHASVVPVTQEAEAGPLQAGSSRL